MTREGTVAPAAPVIALADHLVGCERLESHGDHDGVLLDAVDLTDQRAHGTRITRSRLRRCTLDGVDLSGALLAECAVERIEAARLDLVGARLRDVELTSAGVGGLQAHDAGLTRVVLRDSRLGYVNLRGATLVDVAFERCSIGDLDIGGATLQRVGFKESTIERLSCPRTALADVDLTGVDVDAVSDPPQLRGATISTAQLARFCRTFAEHLGVSVADAP